MCVIAIKKSGLDLPDEDSLINCFKNNDDGAGIMYVKDNKVIIEKGLMKIGTFLKTLDKIKKLVDVKATPMVFHFRIGTQGGNTPQNTHPFPISDDEDMLTKLRVVTDIGVVHNGIISLTSSYKKDIKMSDTMLFIKDYLTLISTDKSFYKKQHFLDLIEKLIDSKMVFLTNTGEIVTLGKFIEDTNGIMYSNTSYLKSYYSYMYAQEYDDDYWANKYSSYPYNSSTSIGSSTSTNTSLTTDFVSRREEKMMWLPACYYHDGNDYYELPEYEYLIDKWDNIYEYDFETDEVWYYGSYKVFTEDLKQIYFEDDLADYVRVGRIIKALNDQEEKDKADVAKILAEIEDDDAPFIDETKGAKGA